MDKGLLIYWLNPNHYQADAQDKEMTEAYDHFVQKLRAENPELSAEYEDDGDFIEEAASKLFGKNPLVSVNRTTFLVHARLYR